MEEINYSIKKKFLDTRVMDGVHKVFKFYLVAKFGQIFNTKFKGAATYNPKVYQFKRSPPRVMFKKTYGNDELYRVMYEKYEAAYKDKNFKHESSDESEYGIETLSYTPKIQSKLIDSTTTTTISNKKEDSSDDSNQCHKGLTKEQVKKGWITVPAPDDMFSKDFFKMFIGKITSDNAIFCKNRYCQKSIYFYNEVDRVFINIQDVKDVIYETKENKENAPPGLTIINTNKSTNDNHY